MANPRLIKKGTKGAAANYISRQQAIKKLQCSLADFRRLCILKGIYPREPRNKKKANKGSTAPTSFYYVKDIQFLLHEPVLEKLREQKTFAKKLAKALGRSEFGLAKNLEDNKPRYRLDHIIKERYPTFQESLRDLDDALSLIVLFAHLPANKTVPASIISNCAKLYAQWQLYVIKTRSLKKVFLSIKGIYYQAQVKGVPITWLVPYQFTQHIPTDIDFRIMMTFLELYQTLLGFVFYRLYTDTNLIYPPPIDLTKEDSAAGLGALMLTEATSNLLDNFDKPQTNGNGHQQPKISAKQVKQSIKSITAEAVPHEGTESDDQMLVPASEPAPIEEVEADQATKLFDNYYFYISREVTRPFLEFIIRSFGGQVGWDATLGSGSPFTDQDPRITHHIVDRPLPTDPVALSSLLQERNALPGKRAFVQPQWIVDCINQQEIKSTGLYEPGATLPPHLSPFVDDRTIAKQGGYVPKEALAALPDLAAEQKQDDDGDSSEVEEVEDGGAEVKFASDEDYNSDDYKEDRLSGTSRIEKVWPPALLASVMNPQSDSLRHAAELEAEARNVSHEEFEQERLEASQHVAGQRGKKRVPSKNSSSAESNLNDIMITGKKRKLIDNYERRKAKVMGETKKLQKKQQKLSKAK